MLPLIMKIQDPLKYAYFNFSVKLKATNDQANKQSWFMSMMI